MNRVYSVFLFFAAFSSMAGALEYSSAIICCFFMFLVRSRSISRGMQKCRGGHFSLETTLRLGVQMVSLLRMLHSTGYVHRDIKPENFCVVSERARIGPPCPAGKAVTNYGTLLCGRVR